MYKERARKAAETRACHKVELLENAALNAAQAKPNDILHCRTLCYNSEPFYPQIPSPGKGQGKSSTWIQVSRLFSLSPNIS